MLGLTAIAEVGKAVVGFADELHTSDEERARAELERLKIMQKPMAAQAEINLAEAKHRSVLVAGWRPSIGWACSAGLWMYFVVYPCWLWVIAVMNNPGADLPPPAIDTGDLMTLTLAILGMGGLRTFEKAKKLTR